MANPSSQFLQIKPPSTTALASTVVGLTLVAAVIAGNLQYSRKESVFGFISSKEGELRILAPGPGVFRTDLKSGQLVLKDQPLGTVETLETASKQQSFVQIQKRSLSDRRLSFEREYLEARRQVETQRASVLEQIRHVEDAIEQTQSEQKTREELLRIEQANYQRQETLVQQNFVARSSLDTARAAVLTRDAELRAVKRSALAAREQVASHKNDLAALDARLTSLLEQKTRDVAALDSADGQVLHDAATSIYAPAKGRLSSVIVTSGETVLAGQLLAKLTPGTDSLVATLVLPATANGRVKPGQKVLLRMSAFPFTTFGQVETEIEAVEDTPLLADEVPSLKENGVLAGAVIYRARARILKVPDTIGANALRPGMQFDGAVEIERKSFLATMLWPLLKNLY